MLSDDEYAKLTTVCASLGCTVGPNEMHVLVNDKRSRPYYVSKKGGVVEVWAGHRASDNTAYEIQKRMRDGSKVP